jgi:hypothetical protein
MLLRQNLLGFRQEEENDNKGYHVQTSVEAKRYRIY